LFVRRANERDGLARFTQLAERGLGVVEERLERRRTGAGTTSGARFARSRAVGNATERPSLVETTDGPSVAL